MAMMRTSSAVQQLVRCPLLLLALLATLLCAAPVAIATRGRGRGRGEGDAGSTCTGNNPGIFYYSLGSAQLTALSDGVNRVPVGLAFIDDVSVLTRVAAYTAPLPSLDPFPFFANALLLEMGDRKILIDAGGGPLVETQGLLPGQLETIGIDPSEIDDVLITHAHFDHLGGLIVDTETDELQFPNANVHIARAEYEFWNDPDAKLTMGLDDYEGIDDVRQSIIDAAQLVFAKIPADKLKLFEEGDTILPGVSAPRLAPWHTPGSAIFVIDPPDAEQPLVITGDALPGAGMGLQAPWIRSGFDELAEEGPEAKWQLLEWALAEGALLHGFHAPFPAIFALAPDGLAVRGVNVLWDERPGIGHTCPRD